MLQAFLGSAVTVGPRTSNAYEVYFVQWQSAPSPQETELLLRVVGGVETFASTTGFLLLPRTGTISPWSSKATDITKRCGLHNLQRVECGHWFNSDDEAYVLSLYDRMTQTYLKDEQIVQWSDLFVASQQPTEQSEQIDFSQDGFAVLSQLNDEQGFALSDDEIHHLLNFYSNEQRMAQMAELMMFAQANSEHCRHKIFTAPWQGGASDSDNASLMSMIKKTHAHTPQATVLAYTDNSAMIESAATQTFDINASGFYENQFVQMHTVMKAETHNHPTAIEPFAGAATGNGGEIRDEAAAGRGATTRAGFAGFMVSDLGLLSAPTQAIDAPPEHVATPLDIMIKAPLGASLYNNEFGRPTLSGFFRSYQQATAGRLYGYHKPVMLAGGIGQIRANNVGKKPLPVGAKIIQLGGIGFRIGIGGGAASSRVDGGDVRLDFNSVQRDNAEMQRRAQCVVDHCSRHQNNPILSLHDVGAGGLANAIIELVNDANRGAHIDLQAIPVAEKNMTAAEIWCNESQERYILSLLDTSIADFKKWCERESCPFAVLGSVTQEQHIVVEDNGNKVVDMPLKVLFDTTPVPALQWLDSPQPPQPPVPPLFTYDDLSHAVRDLLQHPTIANKRFLINIGDRSVGGLTARDQMIGAWQIAVADCGIVHHDFSGYGGNALALGECPVIATQSVETSVRMAVTEALLNLASADCSVQPIKLSMNWMANCADETRHNELRRAVQAATDFCMQMNASIIVGKDSLSMKMKGRATDNIIESPVTAVVTAVGSMYDVCRHWTPQLSGSDSTYLLRLALSKHQRVACSMASTIGIFSASTAVPDVESQSLKNLLQLLGECREQNYVLAYHDVSDGGALVTLFEMALSARCGLDIFVDALAFESAETDNDHGDNWLLKAAQILFCEEPSCIVEVDQSNVADLMQRCIDYGISAQTIARPQNKDLSLRVYGGGKTLLCESLNTLWQAWDNTSYEICKRRDNPDCAEQEHQRDFSNDTGLFATIPKQLMDFPAINTCRPKVAIFREQGINGNREMAAAFTQAGFDAVDITTTDLLHGHKQLDDSYQGIALCGGFSFGDVLGSGRGWALSILHHQHLSKMFASFFANPNTFALGVCNGCQTLSHLQSLMPQSDNWHFPNFKHNVSRRFEARLSMVEIAKSDSPWLQGMAGLQYPIVVSHGEGQAVFCDTTTTHSKNEAATVLHYIDNKGNATEAYPYNPNGSVRGQNGFCSPDGRILLMMPHPERVFRASQLSWNPQAINRQYSPWMRLFINSRQFIT